MLFQNGYEAIINYLQKKTDEKYKNEKKIISNYSIYDSLELRNDLDRHFQNNIEEIKCEIDKLWDNDKKCFFEDKPEEIVDLFNIINILTKKFKDTLKKYKIEISKKIFSEKTNELEKETKETAQLYSFLFQKMGNNIRSSGIPFNNTEFTGTNMFDLAIFANYIIKAYRDITNKHNKNHPNDKKSTLICIDAIRNPYEATFFKDRYAAFYLISINTEEEERKRRLSHLNIHEIENLDDCEYPQKPTKKKNSIINIYKHA